MPFQRSSCAAPGALQRLPRRLRARFIARLPRAAALPRALAPFMNTAALCAFRASRRSHIIRACAAPRFTLRARRHGAPLAAAARAYRAGNLAHIFAVRIFIVRRDGAHIAVLCSIAHHHRLTTYRRRQRVNGMARRASRITRRVCQHVRLLSCANAMAASHEQRLCAYRGACHQRLQQWRASALLLI